MSGEVKSFACIGVLVKCWNEFEIERGTLLTNYMIHFTARFSTELTRFGLISGIFSKEIIFFIQILWKFVVRKMDSSSFSEDLDDSNDKSYEITSNDKANEKCDLADDFEAQPNSNVSFDFFF